MIYALAHLTVELPKDKLPVDIGSKELSVGLIAHPRDNPFVLPFCAAVKIILHPPCVASKFSVATTVTYADECLSPSTLLYCPSQF